MIKISTKYRIAIEVVLFVVISFFIIHNTNPINIKEQVKKNISCKEIKKSNIDLINRLHAAPTYIATSALSTQLLAQLKFFEMECKK